MWSKKSLFFAPLLFLFFSPFCIFCEHNVSPFPERKSFVIIVAAYNASSVCELALQSFATQTYPQFRVVYVDDGSSDATRQKVEEFLKNSAQKNRFSFLRYDRRKGSVERLIEEAQKCAPHEIIVFLEGTSLLSSPNVLQKLNDLYTKKEALVVWGQHQELETKDIGPCKKVKSATLFSHSMRGKKWERCRIKSFYALLFNQIPIEDFFFRGQCVDETFDKAYMFPLLEMAGDHALFVKDVLCLSSQKEETDKTRPCQRSPIKCGQMIRNHAPLAPLKKPLLSPAPAGMADLIIFSYDRPLQIYALLESIQKHLQGLQQISVLFRTSSFAFEKAYADLKKEFPHLQWVAQSQEHPREDFQTLLLQTIFSSPSPYILFAVDDMIVKKDANLQECAHFLEKNHAFFFSLRLGKDITTCYMGKYDQALPHHLFLQDRVLAWQINAAQGDWNYATSVDMNLYRKKDVKKCFNRIHFHNPNELEPAWERYLESHQTTQRKKGMGLCYEDPVVLNIPLNLVNKSDNSHMNLFSPNELLQLFEKGEKIDIAPLEKVKNHTVHVEITPTFIKREKKTD